MNQALGAAGLSEEAQAFLNGDQPPVDPAPSTVSDPPVSAPPEMESNPVYTPPRSSAIPTLSGTVSMTFRLPASLSAQLLRASGQRKLRRERPYTQQEIVAEALSAWFQMHQA